MLFGLKFLCTRCVLLKGNSIANMAESLRGMFEFGANVFRGCTSLLAGNKLRFTISCDFARVNHHYIF